MTTSELNFVSQKERIFSVSQRVNLNDLYPFLAEGTPRSFVVSGHIVKSKTKTKSLLMITVINNCHYQTRQKLPVVKGHKVQWCTESINRSVSFKGFLSSLTNSNRFGRLNFKGFFHFCFVIAVPETKFVQGCFVIVFWETRLLCMKLLLKNKIVLKLVLPCVRGDYSFGRCLKT